jgi:hypothetical protein
MALKINDNGKTRNMTPDEEAAHLAWAEQFETQKTAEANAAEAKAAARQAVLNKLGLTADEAAALFG